MLTDGELLRILTHHADYYTALSLTESDFSAFLSVASLFAAEATSDRRTPLSASLSELALSGGFLCFADALASVLPLYGALAQRLTKADIAALRQGDKARRRILLTYTHTLVFRKLYEGELPEEADRITSAYLATRRMPKLRRVREVRRLGCTMQSPVTRMGQIIFG